MTEHRDRDPEVRKLLLDSLRLVIQAESVLTQLVAHQKQVAAFLDHAVEFTDDQLRDKQQEKEDGNA